MEKVQVKVPATTANLGPGYDCLGLALDLWNNVTFSQDSSGIHIEIEGEGSSTLPRNAGNQILRAAVRVFQECGHPIPKNMQINCQNKIPLGSGLGSSAAAVLSGLLGANALCGNRLSKDEILKLGVEFEGHPDNLAPALLGGLVVTAQSTREQQPVAIKIPIADFSMVVVVPKFDLPTATARAALPESIPLQDAVYNIGRTAMVIQALQSGDLTLLYIAMDDHLHQPYRLKLIPGAQEALKAASQVGAPAALSGAGPGVIAFALPESDVSAADLATRIEIAFQTAGLPARSWVLRSSETGAQVELF